MQAMPQFLSREAMAGATVSVFCWKGASPFKACALQPCTESHCVLVTEGGEQLEVNEQFVVPYQGLKLGQCPTSPAPLSLLATSSTSILSTDATVGERTRFGRCN